MTFCLYFMFSLVSMATFETNRYNLKWSNRSYWDPIILVPRFRNMVTVMEFKVKQARKQINFVRELKLDIFIHMVHLRMEVSAVYRRYLHVATGGNGKESTQRSSPVFSQTLRAPYMLESWQCGFIKSKRLWSLKISWKFRVP